MRQRMLKFFLQFSVHTAFEVDIQFNSTLNVFFLSQWLKIFGFVQFFNLKYFNLKIQRKNFKNFSFAENLFFLR